MFLRLLYISISLDRYAVILSLFFSFLSSFPIVQPFFKISISQARFPFFHFTPSASLYRNTIFFLFSLPSLLRGWFLVRTILVSFLLFHSFCFQITTSQYYLLSFLPSFFSEGLAPFQKNLGFLSSISLLLNRYIAIPSSFFPLFLLF